MVHARMNFGKYDGYTVGQVPTSYLRWCLRECQCLSPWLRRCIQAELQQRGEHREQIYRHQEQQAPPPADWLTIIRRWHAEMAMKFHPDRGGSHEAMVAINAAHERLRELAGCN